MMSLSVVVPAYNESAVIEHTLSYLLADGRLVSTEVLVICNGCSDDTASLVSAFTQSNIDLLTDRKLTIEVVETEVASKTNAINIGIERASGEYIILLDADIHVSGATLISLMQNLIETGKDLLSPSVSFDYEYASFWVREYYKVASTSSYNKRYRFSNVIAMSKVGVKCLGPLPEVIADDEYLRRQFKQEQVSICEELNFCFACPTNARDLLSILTRIQRGNYQLAQLGVKDHMEMEKVKVSAPSFSSFFIFSAFKLLSKLHALWQLKTGKAIVWEKDNSSRDRLINNED